MTSFRFSNEGAVGDNMHSGDNACGRNQSHDSGEPLSLPVMEYIERYTDRLDGRLFSAMHIVGDVSQISEVCTGRMCDIAAGARIKRWRHWADAFLLTHWVISVKKQSVYLLICGDLV